MHPFVPAVTFTALDWFWVVAFLVLLVGSGVLFYRLGKRSDADFFLAGRRLPWWLPASSVYATHTATDTPMWVSGVIYTHGLRGLWYTFFAAWCAVSAFISTRIFRRSLAFSHAEWQSLRFGGLGGEMMRGWVAGWQVFMNMFIAGWVGIAMGKVCMYLFDWPVWLGMVIFSSVCAIYTLAAGYWGVVVSEFQQGVIMFVTILIVSIWGIQEAGGAGQIIAVLAERGESWRLDPFAFTGWFDGDFPIAWFLTMVFIAFVGGIGMGTSVDWYVEAQRIQSARTVRDASYSIWAGTALVLTRNAVWAVAILAFYVMFPDIPDQKDYEMAWFRLGFDFLPSGMLGFFFAGIVAIHVSTVSGILNLGALYATRDIYHHYINPQASQRRLIWVGRWATVMILLGSFLYGSMMEDITRWLIFALWIMAAGVWLPNILQVVWWRFNAWGALAAWIGNLGFSWLVVWILPAFGLIPELQEYEQFWVLMAMGVVIFLPVVYLTPPEDMDHLVKYYVRARPVGWWGPVRKEAVRRGLLKLPNQV